jgi:hypothetical protein
METVLGELRSRIEPLERLIQLFADSLEQPKLYRFDSDRGFRFETPDIRHFCLLKAIRVVSALNPSLELVRGGYTQEFAVLLRTLVECTTHIEYRTFLFQYREHAHAWIHLHFGTARNGGRNIFVESGEHWQIG